jgi:CDP-glucose 4,6-dehydratase
MGTVHVLDACRRAESIRAIVAVTSDKCYENREWVWPYRETDPMGGHDPYSSSKGAAELVISAYRRSFFETGARIASVRAGNVIGGGDWATDRLIPDVVRAMLSGERPLIRSPNSIRPWQHVMDALNGYLLIGERLLEGRDEFASGWNFGPLEDDARPVSWVVQRLLEIWGAHGWEQENSSQPHEAIHLKLDCSRARAALGWRPHLTLDRALKMVVEWHQCLAAGADARELTLRQIREYSDLAGVNAREVRI